ncbi:hypothetical protein AK830_g1829 [Neonectria ditissima]|uniref:Uncharacterized protein n=1 Tax=Neonectria ditissima TaxID=78410 RepID=A0A0N8H8I8_9HYPO|nr:hypothetical protein AK830_g1829 [Neonectria ditissima]
MEKPTRKTAPRRATDARREQNRVASRNYQPDDIGSSSGHGNNNLNASASIDENNATIAEIPVVSDPDISYIGSVLEANLLDTEEQTAQEHNTSFQPQPFIANDWPTIAPPVPSVAVNQDEALSKVMQGVQGLSLSQKRRLIQQLEQQTQDAINLPSSPSSSTTPRPQQQSRNPAILLSQPSHIVPSTRLQLEALQFSLALSLTATGPTRAPSQYAMNTGLFSALFANCYALGMSDVEPLLVDEGWSVFGLGPEIGYHPSQLSVVRARFRNLTPDLRPCDLQLTFAHHPYIDVLPFKSFRENIIKALDHDPPLIDEDVLCRDVLAGMVCWGSQHNTLGMGVAVPWDVRCWEPSVWFLHKYRHLVGEWDGEMWRGARRWHSMRGERIQATPPP